jgi:hypothetical protein
MEDQNIIKGRIKTSETEEVEVPVRLLMSKFLPSVVAQHLTIQASSGNIIIAFYEANPPIMLNPTPDSFEKLQKEGLTAECVARICIPLALFPGVADAFSQVAEQIKAREKEGKIQDVIIETDQR